MSWVLDLVVLFCSEFRAELLAFGAPKRGESKHSLCLGSEQAEQGPEAGPEVSVCLARLEDLAAWIQRMEDPLVKQLTSWVHGLQNLWEDNFSGK